MLVIIILFTTVLLALWIIFDLLKNSELSILFTPSDAEITVNGRHSSNGIYRMYPGMVTVEIKKDGFDPQQFNIELKSHEVSQIYGYLKPNDGSFEVFKTSGRDYNILKLVANDEEALAFIDKNEKQNRIIDFLPAFSSVEKIPYATVEVTDGTDSEQCLAEFCLRLTATNVDNDKAYNVMKQYFEIKGYNLDNYKVIYE